jgi:pimeloyl-ACP methyl ester carboxylesterase
LTKLISIAAVLFATVLLTAQTGPVSAGFKDGYADVNGIRLHYVTAGQPDRPMIMFVHGYFNFSYYWEDQLAEFGKDHFAVAPDMRGYYLSSRPTELEQYKLKYLVEDVRQLNQKLNGGRKFTLVAHDWGGIVAFVFAMYHPELVDKLIVSNAPHPQMFERELNENSWQRSSSNYMLRFSGYDEQKIPDTVTREAATRRMQTGWVADQIKLGRYSEADREKWIDALSTPGAQGAATNWYRANDLNPPFNDTHPASQVARSWSAKAVTEGAKSDVLKMPTLIVWGVNDAALPPGNLTGFDKYFTDVKIRLFPTEGHNVTQMRYKEVNAQIREFLERRPMPKELVVRTP